MDFGAKVNNYCSDMTRMVFLGKATDEQKKVCHIVLEAQKQVIEYLTQRCHSDSEGGEEGESRSFDLRLQDDMKAKDIDKVARNYIISHGYPAIPHGLGHGVGLSPHELPRLGPKSPVKGWSASGGKDILKPGMVFSIEPGIYLPRRIGGFGVRIEDLVVLTKSGPQILSKSPKKIIEL